MELRLGNQQRHTITAVLLSAVVFIFGFVIADMLRGSEPDPLGTLTETDVTAPEADEDLTAGVARSNAQFTLNPDVSLPPVESSTTTTSEPRQVTTTTAAAVVTRAPTTRTESSTTTTASSSTSSSSSTTTTSTTVTTVTTKDPPGRPSTTVDDDDETTTTKKCRGNRPGCRKP